MAAACPRSIEFLPFRNRTLILILGLDDPRRPRARSVPSAVCRWLQVPRQLILPPPSPFELAVGGLLMVARAILPTPFAVPAATRIGLCHLLASAKHLHLGEAQVVCAGELHANIPALGAGGSNGGGGMGRRGLMALPRPGPSL